MTLHRISPCVLLVLALLMPRPVAAQCGQTVAGRFGGDTTAVAQVNASTLMVARGTEVEMFSLANPSAPAPYSPRRRMGLAAPAIKISMTQGSSRAFVLLANGCVQALNIAGSSFVNTGPPSMFYGTQAVDIAADGQRVYIAASDDGDDGDHPYTRLVEFDASSGVPVFVWETLDPTYSYAYDRLAIVNNILWVGFHQRNSVILGVEGYNLSTPTSPERTGAALTNGPLGQYPARISAMTAIDTKLLVSYRHGVSNDEDWLRAVNVSVPTNPVWNSAFDLNGYAGRMSSVGNQLRISIKNSGVGTWDTTNPGALSWLGAYFDTDLEIGQMVSVPSTDYWAGGAKGLMTMNTATVNPPTPRSAPIVPLPTSPSVVRQRGNISVVLDYTLNALRFFDYTLPESQQLRGSLDLPWYSELLELGDGLGGIPLACVASQGNPAGDVIAVIDFSNPAAPFLRHTITGFRTHLLSISSSRLYAFTTNEEFRIYELTNSPPLVPRSVTHYGGDYTHYTCMTSWSNNAAALGTKLYGLWLLDTTNATAPSVASVWNPVAGYRVNSMVKSPNYLYVSASVGPDPLSTTDTRLEAVIVSTITSPTLRFAVSSTTGYGNPGTFSSLAYVSNATGKFLVGLHGEAHEPGVFNDDTQWNSVTILELLSFFFVENVPTPIAHQTVPLGHGNIAVSADGSRFLVAGDAAGLYQIAMPTTWAPGFGLRTFDQTACPGAASVQFSSVVSANPLPVTFQWYRDGVALTDGPTPWGSTITGAADWAMVITNPRSQDSWATPFSLYRYHCVATNSCGSTPGPYSELLICYANCDCSTVAPTINIQDFSCFINKFAAGDPYANCDNSTVPPTINVQDFSCFLNRFASGCY